MMDTAQSERFLNEWIGKTGSEHWSDLHHCVKMMLCHVKALCRAIEQHEAFKREVSDAVEDVVEELRPTKVALLSRFIIPKPVDPLVEALNAVNPDVSHGECDAELFRAAIEARGGRIVWEGE